MPFNLIYQPALTAIIVWFILYLAGQFMRKPVHMVLFHIMALAGGTGAFFLYALPGGFVHALGYGGTYGVMYIILLALFGELGE